MHAHPCAFLLLFALQPLGSALGQNGDNPSEAQPPLPESLVIPPAPALSPEQALESFVLAPGLSIELAAAEPLVQDPVCMAFDGDGRMWVAEMRAYMRNVDGEREDAPSGRIAILSDSDGDGVFDTRVDFLEGLVLPRAVLPYRDGALVIAPPELAFYRDEDGDGKADGRQVIARGLGGLASPEHAINGLRWTHDNWIQASNHSLRFRETEQGWITQRTGGGGQWGLTLDEEGRAFYNTNSDGLRGDTFSSHYAVRNSNYGRAGGMNVRVAESQEVWPARITPGVNRGYQPITLRDDFTLRNFTGACGPLVYLGGAFPSEFQGNAFVAEPCGNLIKRYRLLDKDGLGFLGKNAYQQREFLASTDERFRPVNLYDGPGGALFVVDLYRGLIQHRVFVTSWLRQQVLERKLETPTGMGRIWRVRHDSMGEQALPQLSEASWSELASQLHSPNGWLRLTAQRLIVEDGAGDVDALEVTRQAFEEGPTALGRMHALWALSGIDGLDRKLLSKGLGDADERVQRAAVRCAEPYLATGDAPLLERFRQLAEAASPRLMRQMIFSLGEAQTRAADDLLADWMLADASRAEMRSAVLSGLGGRELGLLRQLHGSPGWSLERPGRRELVRELARCIAREERHASLDELLSLIASTGQGGSGATSLIEGLLAGRPQGGLGQWLPLSCAQEPGAWASLSRLASAESGGAVRDLLPWITWPGGPNAPEEGPRALVASEELSFQRGREIYANICAACHQHSGRGAGGLAPSLRYSPWLLQDPKTPIRILLGGLRGPLEVAGETWNLEMPAFDASPAEVADVLTYARREWGNGADPIRVEDVLKVQLEMRQRTSPWTPQELQTE